MYIVFLELNVTVLCPFTKKHHFPLLVTVHSYIVVEILTVAFLPKYCSKNKSNEDYNCNRYAKCYSYMISPWNTLNTLHFYPKIMPFLFINVMAIYYLKPSWCNNAKLNHTFSFVFTDGVTFECTFFFDALITSWTKRKANMSDNTLWHCFADISLRSYIYCTSSSSQIFEGEELTLYKSGTFYRVLCHSSDPPYSDT